MQRSTPPGPHTPWRLEPNRSKLMRLQPTVAALAAALALTAPAAFGGADDGALGTGTFPSGCTSEARRCEEKLAALGFPGYRPYHHSPQREQAILDLLEVDPDCATVLWGLAFP
jgi:hypothetical protein